MSAETVQFGATSELRVTRSSSSSTTLRGISGHASVFGQVSDVGRYWESVEERAFDGVLSSPDTDARALVNHDHRLVLGRQSAGTLVLRSDRDGLSFDIPSLPDTTYARDLAESVERGDVTGASFGFVPGAVKTGVAPDGREVRHHTEVARLVEVSIVTFPAYEGAKIALRSVQFTAGGRQNDRSKLIRVRARLRMKGT